MVASALERGTYWTDEADAYLALAAHSPSRRVGGSGGHHNCVHVFPSDKMHFALRAESHLERGCFLRLEYDDEVVAYYDQPPSVELLTLSKSGRRQRVRYTPDVLVRRRSGLEVLEVKTAEACENLVASRPQAWAKVDGSYVYVPARDYFAKWDISFRVVTEADQDPLETENLDLLGRISRASTVVLQKRQLASLHSLLDGKVLTIGDVAKSLGLIDLSGLLELVRQKRICCDITKSNLSKPGEALVSTDPNLLRSAHAGLARCDIHAVALQNSCPHCGRFQRFKSRDLDLAVCAYCSKRLTDGCVVEAVRTPSMGERDLIEVVEAVARNPDMSFAENAPEVFFRRSQKSFKRSTLTAELGDTFRVRTNFVRARLRTLLKMANFFQVPLLRILEDPIGASEQTSRALFDSGKASHQSRPRNEEATSTELEAHLVRALEASGDPETLRSICQAHNVSLARFLLSR